MENQLHENLLCVMILGVGTHTHTHFPIRKCNKEFVSGLTLGKKIFSFITFNFKQDFRQ